MSGRCILSKSAVIRQVEFCENAVTCCWELRRNISVIIRMPWHLHLLKFQIKLYIFVNFSCKPKAMRRVSQWCGNTTWCDWTFTLTFTQTVVGKSSVACFHFDGNYCAELIVIKSKFVNLYYIGPYKSIPELLICHSQYTFSTI